MNFRDMEPNARGGVPAPRVVAVTSGKGGVGKSSISVNLAITLAKSGHKVCLLDADTGLANVNILLGLTPQYRLEHVLFGSRPIEDVMLKGPAGLKVIPGAHGISECVNLPAQQRARLSEELSRIERHFDYLMLDTAAGISDTTLDMVSAAHQVLLVITPEPTSLTDAFSLIKVMGKRQQKPVFQVVVNLCSSLSQANEVYHRFNAAVKKYLSQETQLLGHIQRDESFRAAVTLQKPVALFPDSDPSARSFVRLAETLEQRHRFAHPELSFSRYWALHDTPESAMQSDSERVEGSSEYDPSMTMPVVAVVRESPVDAVVVKGVPDTQYFGELKSRVLLEMAKQDVPSQDLRELMEALMVAYQRQFGTLPVDPVNLVSELVTSNERDDALLRRIAKLVSAWHPVSESVPQVEPEQILVTEIEEAKPLVQRAKLSTQRHRFDASKFGSQDKLLKQLRSNQGSQRSLTEWLQAVTET